MSKFNAGQSFADGDTVTGAKLNNIAGLLDIYTGLISEQTAMSATVSTADQLLIADVDNGDSGAANRVTVQKLLNDTLTNGTFTSLNLTGNLNVAQLSTLGTINNTRGTVGILNSTTGTIATLNSTTGTIATLNSTTGTIATLNSTTGTIATLNSTTGTIATLNSTTGTITTGVIPTLTSTTLITTGTGTAAAPAIVPTGDTNTGIFFPAAGTIAFSEGGAEAMRITSSGNVGIGITNPQGKLGIGDASTQCTLTPDSANTRFVIGTDGASALALSTNGGTKMTILSGGNVGIGTASPSAQLELSTDSAKKPSSNTWTIGSDQRLKTNITNADNDRCYEIVKQVPLKRYSWKNEVYSQEQVRDRSKLGWIAQDVEAVFPKAVGTNRFAYNQVFEDVVTPELDSDGNAVLDENGVAKTKIEKRLVSEDVIEDCKDLNSDQIYAAMYGTIQKLIEKVEFLESKVTALEAA